MFKLPGTAFFGDVYKQLRDAMKADGCKYDSRAVEWTLPSEEIYLKYKAKVPGTSQVIPSVAKGNPLPKAVVPTKPVAKGNQETVGEANQVPSLLSRKTEARQEDSTSLGEAKSTTLGNAKKVLRINPSRYALVSVSIEPKGWERPRRRRVLDEQIEHGSRGGIETLTKMTKAETMIVNPKELEQAKKIQSSEGYKLRRIGTRVADGVLLFPLTAEGAFDSARASAKAEAAGFNAGSTHYEVVVDAIKLGVIESEERQVAQKMTYEIQTVLFELQSAITRCDAKAIREAALAAKYKVDGIGDSSLRSTLANAVSEAREAAKYIIAETEKAGRTIEDVQADVAVRYSSVSTAQMAFLELEVPVEVQASRSGEASFGVNQMAAAQIANLELGTGESSGTQPRPQTSTKLDASPMLPIFDLSLQ